MNQDTRSALDPLLLYAGVRGMVFALSFTLLVAVPPGYHLTPDTNSFLELTQFGWLQLANSLCCGGSLFAFALGLRRELGLGKGSILIPVLQSTSAIGVVGAGLFSGPPLHLVCDLLAFNSAVAVLLASHGTFGRVSAGVDGVLTAP